MVFGFIAMGSRLKMTVNKLWIFIIAISALPSCGQNSEMKNSDKHTNELVNETSPYLLQHAHNPVDWHAWNEENLKEAEKLDKPLLISIGYSSCHWCHVMEHESFEDDEIADYMNEHFYCIKVDREERPDVDQVYMSAANIITGRGGWPLNCFALPNGKPFHAGTYYPKDGWLKLLQTIHLQYTSQRDKITSYANKLTQGIRLQETAISDQKSEDLDFNKLVAAVEGWKNQWDMNWGGINRAPKFPMPSNTSFLLDYAKFSKDSYTDEFVEVTLDKMALGGIYDQIGGGFARYSTDKIWKVPHFEKMLYDNAQLLTLYANGYAKYKKPLYLATVNGIITWLQREMLDESNLFYSALDADSEGEEGKFYVWTEKQIDSLLGEDAAAYKEYYEVNKTGLWEHGNNILMTTERTSAPTNLDKSNTILLNARNQRIAPGLDDKCLTSWNAMLVSGLCDAYTVTNNESHKQLAINALDTLLKHQFRNDKILHSFKKGKSTIDGMLEDYAFLGQACLDVFKLTGNESYLSSCNSIISLAVAKFYDQEKEMFYFNTANELVVRVAEIYDNVIPATNSAMANLLTEAGLVNGNTQQLKLAQTLIGKVQENIGSYPGGHSNWARVHLKHSRPFYEVVIIGSEAQELAEKMNSLFIPNAMVVQSLNGGSVPIFKDRLKTNETLIYVCEKGVCQLPVKTINEALKQIQ